MTGKTCDDCVYWRFPDDPECQYCEMYTVCPTIDIYVFMINMGYLGKCPLFEGNQ